MTVVYRLILLFYICMTTWTTLTSKDKKVQALGAMILIPFVLRFLMIK